MHAEELVRHNAFLRRLATSLLRGEQDVDDVVQEAYLRALQRRPTRPRAWLGKVVRNLAFRRHRTSARVAHRERSAARPEALPCPSEDVERLEVQRKVVSAVLGLDEPYRSVVIRRYLDELSAREIARRSGVPLETVRTRLGRALRELRRRLDAEHASWAPALALLVLHPPRLSVMGGVLMSAKSKTLMASMAVLGIGVGVAGHAAFLGSGEHALRAPYTVREGNLAAEVADLRAEVVSLRREMDQLRSGDGTVDTPGKARGRDTSVSDSQRARQALEDLLAIEHGERNLAIRWAFENLVKQGDAVVPEIVALLKTDRDQDYGGGFSFAGNAVTSYPRLRTVLIDALRQIGSPAAREGLLEAIRGSSDLLDHRDVHLLYHTTADEEMVAGVSELLPGVLDLVERSGRYRNPSFVYQVRKWIDKHKPPGSADMLGRLSLSLLRADGMDFGTFGTLLGLSPDKAFQVAARLHMLTLPDGVLCCSEEDVPKALERPEVPKTGILASLSATPPQFNATALGQNLFPAVERPNATGPRVVADSSAEVEYHVRQIKHRFGQPLDALYVSFPSREAVRSFSMEYRLLAASLPREVTGELHIRVEQEGAAGGSATA